MPRFVPRPMLRATKVPRNRVGGEWRIEINATIEAFHSLAQAGDVPGPAGTHGAALILGVTGRAARVPEPRAAD